jgi:hypothetical protein
MNPIHRRQFLKFIGASGIAILAGWPDKILAQSSALPFTPLGSSPEDALTLAQGFSWQKLIAWEDVINTQSETFGFNNDYIAFLPLDSSGKDALLWVNHEYADPVFVSGRNKKDPPTQMQVMLEQYAVGGSILHIRQNAPGDWSLVKDSQYNKRISGRTEIPFAWHEPIAGASKAIGTVGNCAGGKTPWGTFLTCEENYDAHYGENVRTQDGKYVYQPGSLHWTDHYPYPTQHYGWVVEVNPKTGACRKLVSLGRIAHECATFARAKNGKAVIYTGEDANDECLYKFISDSDQNLDTGELFVANLEKGEWISLDIRRQPELKKVFGTQTEVQIHLRDAAKIVGGTPLDRPEDIEINPLTGDVIISLTNNKPKGNYFGALLKIQEEGNDPGSRKFTSEILLTGGKETGFACPDNLGFDPQGNLWMTSDMAGMHKEPYQTFGNNSLFVIPVKGPQAGQVIRVGNAPIDAEFTGICFSPDGKTLFLSVQHPGENSPSLQELTSHWPDGGNAIPRSAVVCISGPSLEYFTLGD